MKTLLIILVLLTYINAFGQKGLYINSGAYLFNDDSSITIKNGNLVNDNSIVLNGGSIFMQGLDGNSYSLEFNNPNTINNLELYGTSTFSLSGALIVNSELKFNDMSNFHLNTDSHITLSSNAEIIGESNSNIITGENDTYITTTRNHTAGETNTFGNIGLEVFNGTESMGITEIFRRYGNLNIDSNTTVNRYYEINPTINTNLELDAYFYLLDVDLNGLERSNLAAFRSTDNGNTFTNEGGTAGASYHSLTNINAFSLWAFADSAVLNLGNEGNSIETIQIFPNPSNSLVTIKNIKTIDVTSIELTNLLGQKFNIELSNENSFYVHNLSEGIYLLNIKSKTGNTTKKLVIKK